MIGRHVRILERIFSELVNLCFDVVFTHGPQLFVKLGRYLMGAQVLNSLRGMKRKCENAVSSLWVLYRCVTLPGRVPPDCTWLKCCSVWPPLSLSASARFLVCSSQAIWVFLEAEASANCSNNTVKVCKYFIHITRENLDKNCEYFWSLFKLTWLWKQYSITLLVWIVLLKSASNF